jgi:hypothetical protein
MATPKPQRHASSRLFHRHRSNSLTGGQNLEQPSIFKGTDAVDQNRRVALQRVIEVHQALEQQQHHAETGTSSRPTSPASSTSSDLVTIDFNDIPFPDVEVRAFRYFLRKWDPSVEPDQDFKRVIEPSRLQYEEAFVKHFFRRIVLWNESKEVLDAARQRSTKRWRRHETSLTKMWMMEKDYQGQNERDGLKKATTREGLAQLLWTLLHDPTEPLAPELLKECNQALKKYYGMECN